MTHTRAPSSARPQPCAGAARRRPTSSSSANTPTTTAWPITTTVFGTPIDVTLAELAIEASYPADPESAETLRLLATDRPLHA